MSGGCKEATAKRQPGLRGIPGRGQHEQQDGMVQQVGIRQGLLMRSYYTGAVTQVRPAPRLHYRPLTLCPAAY